MCAYVREREIDPSVHEYAHHLCAASLIESVRVRAYIRKRDCVYECFFVFFYLFFQAFASNRRILLTLEDLCRKLLYLATTVI